MVEKIDDTRLQSQHLEATKACSGTLQYVNLLHMSLQLPFQSCSSCKRQYFQYTTTFSTCTCTHSVNFLIPQWISALCINIVVYQGQAHIAGFQLVHHNTTIVWPVELAGQNTLITREQFVLFGWNLHQSICLQTPVSLMSVPLAKKEKKYLFWSLLENTKGCVQSTLVIVNQHSPGLGNHVTAHENALRANVD